MPERLQAKQLPDGATARRLTSTSLPAGPLSRAVLGPELLTVDEVARPLDRTPTKEEAKNNLGMSKIFACKSKAALALTALQYALQLQFDFYLTINLPLEAPCGRSCLRNWKGLVVDKSHAALSVSPREYCASSSAHHHRVPDCKYAR